MLTIKKIIIIDKYRICAIDNDNNVFVKSLESDYLNAGVKFKNIIFNNGDITGIGPDDKLFKWDNDVIVKINTKIKFKQISSSSTHSFGISYDGKTYAWGENHYNQLFIPSSVGLIRHTKPILMKNNGDHKMNFKKLYCGDGYSMAIDDKRRVWTWGNDRNGNIYNNNIIPQKIDKLMADKIVFDTDDTIFAISGTRKVYAWGENTHGKAGVGSREIVDYPKLIKMNIKKISVGYYHVLFINDNNEVYGAGENKCGQLGIGHTNQCYCPKKAKTNIKFKYIKCVGYQSFAISFDDDLWAWGINDYGQLGAGDIRMDQNYDTPIFVKKGFKKIICRTYTHFGICTNGDVYEWGDHVKGYKMKKTKLIMLVSLNRFEKRRKFIYEALYKKQMIDVDISCYDDYSW